MSNAGPIGGVALPKFSIWVDADACPGVVKEILYRAANREQTMVTFVANQMLRVPPSQWIRALQVPAGFDVADERIAQSVHPGDLVVTADIPLASQIVALGAHVLDPRGTVLDEGNIQERLSVRNFLDELRSSGVETRGPNAYVAADRQRFANALDTFLARRRK